MNTRRQPAMGVLLTFGEIAWLGLLIAVVLIAPQWSRMKKDLGAANAQASAYDEVLARYQAQLKQLLRRPFENSGVMPSKKDLDEALEKLINANAQASAYDEVLAKYQAQLKQILGRPFENAGVMPSKKDLEEALAALSTLRERETSAQRYSEVLARHKDLMQRTLRQGIEGSERLPSPNEVDDALATVEKLLEDSGKDLHSYRLAVKTWVNRMKRRGPAELPAETAGYNDLMELDAVLKDIEAKAARTDKPDEQLAALFDYWKDLLAGGPGASSPGTGGIPGAGEFDAQLRRLVATRRQELDKLNQEVAQARATSTDLDKELARKEKELARKEEEIANLRTKENSVRVELLGLQEGTFERPVVFVLDASYTMFGGDTNRWHEVCSVVEQWMRFLPVRQAAIIVFSKDVEQCPAEGFLHLRDDRKELQEAALEQLLAFLNRRAARKPTADDVTNTYKALDTCLKYQEVKTVFLFTDGQPQPSFWADSEKEAARILADLPPQFRQRGIVLNAVGLGDYGDPRLLKFLRNLTGSTNGTFIGK